MKRLLILPFLLLASCAPIISAAQGTASTLTASGTALTFSNGDSQTAGKVVIAVDGASFSDARCALPRDGITVCKLGDVPANNAASLTYTGKIVDANATWRTPKGKLRATLLNR
ncbi:hypothetical protein EHF33_15885 [Deinococcus psychrotolerans]|uniref:Uncharacterized protein n=1 Tax=Deinococcus psychrotolerans TaxID=2489213 RepID=A0A3G8YRI0_9DEIO|nr:hypothetical protein [Deinococcus psychrotolerans]AZI44361.1 hypothetical protein EHF33_15885 [Deinococcus psychrotolerans]